MNDDHKPFVLDTSALLAYTDDEEGAEVIVELLHRARRGEIVLVSFASWMELHYIYLQERGEGEAQRWIETLKQLPLQRVESDERTGEIAAELKAQHRISFADSWIAALAKVRDGMLVHKDPEFETIREEVTLQGLPYK
ncbi:MAG: type II toxin-antitoxin system VapC family toxin [Anaerolineae bacterium]|nr:type II toxin-antitoxin system VapC family toxin [Anaerolineae bacterium]